jgi:hypothetical protein
MKKKLSTLVKEMGMNHVVEYFDYMIDCYLNGNFESCKHLFSEMRKEDQKSLLKYLNGQAQFNGLVQVRNFYFNLL